MFPFFKLEWLPLYHTRHSGGEAPFPYPMILPGTQDTGFLWLEKKLDPDQTRTHGQSVRHLSPTWKWNYGRRTPQKLSDSAA